MSTFAARRDDPEGITIRALEQDFRGQTIRYGDAGYGEARGLGNGAINRFPSVTARCAGPADLVGHWPFGRDSGLPVAGRGGGHSAVTTPTTSCA